MLAADCPRQQGGGPYSDAPEACTSLGMEPPEAAHHEGVGALRPSPGPLHPELAASEWTGLTEFLCSLCPPEPHKEQAGHL